MKTVFLVMNSDNEVDSVWFQRANAERRATKKGRHWAVEEWEVEDEP